jgi:phosphopentomutase
MCIKRVILLVLDGVGIGEAPDADLFGDKGSNTLVNLARVQRGLFLPHLSRLGLGNITLIQGVPPQNKPQGAYGKMQEKSLGKDTTTGHWELAGLVLEKPFPTYPHGFPREVTEVIERMSGRGLLGNYPASGTEIIQKLGEQHMKTGSPIIYTSADSVLQIAAHEDIIPLTELYHICEIARGVCRGEHAVGRIIARPFMGEPGAFQRTSNRKDYSLVPPAKTVLDDLVESGREVWGVGKIEDIFAYRGITQSNHTTDNRSGMNFTMELLEKDFSGLIFINLVDFDSKYGHRNDPAGFAGALEEFDQMLGPLLEKMKPADMLIITADHGCDPTTESTDHSREYVPLLVCGPALKQGVELGIRDTFADVAATLTEIFHLPGSVNGKSFWTEVRNACI